MAGFYTEPEKKTTEEPLMLVDIPLKTFQRNVVWIVNGSKLYF